MFDQVPLRCLWSSTLVRKVYPSPRWHVDGSESTLVRRKDYPRCHVGGKENTLGERKSCKEKNKAKVPRGRERKNSWQFATWEGKKEQLAVCHVGWKERTADSFPRGRERKSSWQLPCGREGKHSKDMKVLSGATRVGENTRDKEIKPTCEGNHF